MTLTAILVALLIVDVVELEALYITFTTIFITSCNLSPRMNFHENYISVLCSERRKFSRQRHPCMGNSLARRHHSDMPKLAFENHPTSYICP